LKFEHVLTVYWKNNFLFNGTLVPFDTSLKYFFTNVGGIQKPFKNLLIQRFEMYQTILMPQTLLPFYGKEALRATNLLLAQISSINKPTSELTRINLIRLYLTKTFRGRGQALGKPVRGQRTWSNAWTAYSSNRVLKTYISETQYLKTKDLKEEKVDYKKLKRKFKKKIKKVSSIDLSAKKAKKLETVWF